MAMSRRQTLALYESFTDEQFGAALCPECPPDPGIVHALRVLCAGGVECFESCQGGPGHCVSDPMIRFHGERAAAWHALAVAQDFALPVLELRRVWTIEDGEPTGPDWTLVFRRQLQAGAGQAETVPAVTGDPVDRLDVVADRAGVVVVVHVGTGQLGVEGCDLCHRASLIGSGGSGESEGSRQGPRQAEAST